jgi:pyruvate-formate lyase-activating enzyme
MQKRHQKKTVDSVFLEPVVANARGEIFELEGFGAVAMAGREPLILTRNQTIDMPFGSELMMLPDRHPVVFNLTTDLFETLHENPYVPGEAIYPVAVFNSPGNVNRYFCAYDTTTAKGQLDLLPLFSYGAVAWDGTGFKSAALEIDREPRQDLRLMPREGVEEGVKKMRAIYPDNRLMRHLERCGLEYGCPAAKNFFLGRFEAPLPTAKTCNADCLGCISFQKENNLVACQERIAFTPTPEEIAQVSLEHINKVEKSVVSFGQGCEGDPLTAFHAIEPAIEMIRKATDQGTINMNTNAGMPDRLERLFTAGLDSVRVSMNSVRPECYTAYFRPKSYKFEDVVRSIDTAGKMGRFVSINYLNCPGVTDCEAEFKTLKSFLSNHPVRMIQWRNMNFDPRGYFEIMDKTGGPSPALGMAFIIAELKRLFPTLIHGYFNPPKENFDQIPWDAQIL